MNTLAQYTGSRMLSLNYSPEDLAVIKSQLCKPKRRESTDAEFSYFMSVANRVGLEPLKREIYAVFRPEKVGNEWVERMGIQTGIDGYRKIAARTGKYAGQDAPEWCTKDLVDGRAVWREVWTESATPFAARVAVYRKDITRPMVAIARWDAYVQQAKDDSGKWGANHMWRRMGPEQLAKCAEALALRKAFPDDLAGIHTTEEMGQADNDAPGTATLVQAPRSLSDLTARLTEKQPTKVYGITQSEDGAIGLVTPEEAAEIAAQERDDSPEAP